MKRILLILLALLLAGAVTLALIARWEPAALPDAADATATPTARPVGAPQATPTAEPTEAPAAATTIPAEAPTPEAIGGDMTLTVPGCQSAVTVTIMVDGSGAITAMTVEAGQEAPGLGRKCAEEGFTAQFIGKSAPFALSGEAAEGVNAVDAVSYATVTSRAVVEAVNALLGAE